MTTKGAVEVEAIKDILKKDILKVEKVSKIATFSEKSSTNEKNARYTTYSEAEKLGVVTENVLPRKCEFCGARLQATGILVGVAGLKRWIHNPDDYEECYCPGAKKHREELAKAKKEHMKAKKEQAYREKIEKMTQESKLGKRFRTRTFESFQISNENRKAYEITKQYAEEFEKYKEKGVGLLLTGSYGTGKTHLAAAICHELIRNDYQPIFGTMISLLGNIKSTYNEYAKETEQQILNKYIHCDLLIIDDLGKERPTDWTLEKLYTVIDSRYEACKPVVITTNYADKLVSRLTYKDNIETAEAIVSRIHEMCVGLMMTWEDYRKL